MSKVERLIFFDPDSPSDDPIDGLLNRLGEKDIKTKPGCKIHRNLENGNIAVFPSVPFYPSNSHEQRKLESEWERRSIQMHDQQKSLPPLADKPSEIIPKYHEITTRRGD